MRKILATLLFSVGIIAAPLIAQAAPCSPSMTFTTGQTLTAAVLNSNPVTFSGCFNNLDYTNIGAAGIFASQMMPTNASQATFGGGQNYTFPNNLTVGGTLTAAIVGGLYPSSMVPTTGAQATFGGSQLYTFPNGVAAGGPVSGTTGTYSGTLSTTGNFVYGGVSFGGTLNGSNGNISTSGVLALSGTGTNSLAGPLLVPGTTSTGAVKQTVSGTTYTVPYDAMSTAGSTNTHIEHGTFSTGTYSGGFACTASQPFIKAFTAAPDIILTAAGGVAGQLYEASRSTTAFTGCSFVSGASSGTALIHWFAIGE